MKTWYDRTYYTLDDVRIDADLITNAKGPFIMSTTGTDISDFISAICSKANISSIFYSGSEYLNKCWQEYIWPKFWNQFICFTDDDSIKAAECFSDMIGQIVAWMKSSDSKYSLIIANQEDNKSKLLGQIRSSGVSKFNDTPQNSGNFSDDEHNTTVTTTESSTDGGTLLSRLNEIEDNLKRLYDNWSNEFRKFIVWSIA